MRLAILFASLSCVSAACWTGCSSMTVRTDYDRQANFGEYRTFAWATHEQAVASGTAASTRDPLFQNPLLSRRIRASIERELGKKGLHPATTGQADFLIAEQVRVREKIESNAVSTGFGYGYGPFLGYAGPGLSVRQYTEGTLIIDFVDAAKNQLFWRGYAVSAIDDPEVSDEKIDEAVRKILEKYPPEPGAK